MSYRFPNFRIFQFAKSPGTRAVKTRLASVLSSSQRRELHSAMCGWVCRRLSESRLAPLTLWIDGEFDDPLFDALARDYGVKRSTQQGRDLGQRLLHAAKAGLAEAEAVVLVGSDCPFIDTAYAAAALQILTSKPAVIGPAADGGYVLLGLRRVADSLFRDIAWGGAMVCTQTQERLEALGWPYAVLPVLDDIDRPQDLLRLSQAELPDNLRRFAGLSR